MLAEADDVLVAGALAAVDAAGVVGLAAVVVAGLVAVVVAGFVAAEVVLGGAVAISKKLYLF